MGKSYDVIVLGGGPAGYHSAMLLSKEKKSVLLIEREKIGGVCLNRGCIPTKSLIHTTRTFKTETVVKEMHAKKRGDISRLHNGLKNQVVKSGVHILEGEGLIKSEENCVVVNEEKYYYDNLIISTGSENMDFARLNINGLEKAMKDGYVVDSDSFLKMDEYPNKIVIIGAGVIGVEFATILNNIGVQVTVLECMPELMGNFLDSDVSGLYTKALASEGIDIILDAKVTDIEDRVVIYDVDGKVDECDADLVILAVGRKAIVENIGLEDSGIELNDGFIKVDSFCRTSIPNIYACGDVIGKQMLAHVAYKEAEVVVSKILENEYEMDYSYVPSVVYSMPELAFSGKNEKYFIENNCEYYVKKKSMQYSSRFMIEKEKQIGICKLIFDSEGVISGAQLIGDGSSETIFVLSDMIASKCHESEIMKKIFPHPSYIEIIKEVIS